jgi:6-phosphogluconolactonase
MGRTKLVPGSLIALPDAARVASEAAKQIAETLRAAITERGRASLALSGGDVHQLAYKALGAYASLDWANIQLFWVDERAVPPTDPRSHFGQAQGLLGANVVRAANIHRMPAEAPDLEAEARAYDALIRTRVPASSPRSPGVPSFDVVVLGIGDDGHTASLFPGEPAVKTVDRLVVPVPAKGDREARLTVTPPILEAARALVILAVGPSKFEPLERAWEVSGNVAEVPARVIRAGRGATTWIIDRAAGGV